jgi:hypothetical protein
MKFLILLRLVFVLSFLGMSEKVLADDPALAGELHVQISNQTNTICMLTLQKTLHGILHSSPPQSLLAGQSASFDMEQTFLFGPSELLKYQCDLNTVEFKVSQPLYIYFGNTPYLTIIESKGLIAIASYAQGSSIIFNNRGLLNVSLKSLNLA